MQLRHGSRGEREELGGEASSRVTVGTGLPGSLRLELLPTFLGLQRKLILHAILPFEAGRGDPALLFSGADEPPTWEKESGD